MKRILNTLRHYYETEATDAERSVLLLILSNPRSAMSMDIHTLARKAGSSASTIIRIAQKNGLSGFRSLKDAIQNDLYAAEGLSVVFKPGPDKSIASIPYQIFREEIEGLEATCQINTMEDLEKAASFFTEAGRIFLFGIGSSQLVARDLQMKLERIGRPTVLYEDFHMQKMASTNASETDLSVFFSYSGETSELLEMADECRAGGSKTLSITRDRSSALSARSDLCLFMPVIEKPLRPGASSSRICMLALVDVLYGLLLSKTEADQLNHIVRTKELMEKEGYR